MAEDQNQGSFETREDAGDGGPGVFRLWMSALELAAEEEKDWRESAMAAESRYRDEKRRRGGRFNILYSTMQTMAPAVYNSTPIPDVRRRFNDRDVVGQVASQVFERALSHCADEYDFDHVMSNGVHDMLLRGRGVSMVVYDPVVGEEGVDYESVRTEHVQWDDFRRGPGKVWADVPWCAVRYRITREEAVALNPKIGGTVTLDHTEKGAEKGEKDIPDIFKRLTVWKIWDKAQRKVVFIAPSYREGPFTVEEDVLKLKDFFPFPRPMLDIPDPSSLVPLVPYEMYRDQAEELDDVSRRIKALVKVLKWRGIRPSQISELDRLKDAEDGELIPSESAAAVLAMSQTGGDMNKAIWLMPIDKLIVIVRELVIHRESIKQVIFEISGIADILRGETDPNETLGAQQIKAQWGSLRMQARQREVQRFARDLLRIKAEIIGEQYSVETLQLVTGIRLPTPELKAQAQMAMQAGQELPEGTQQILDAPTWDEVKKVMASDALRSFQVDIETNSTIQSDLGAAQQNISNFIEGLGGFVQAIGPAVQAGVMPMDVVSDLLTGFARNFKLGKQAEDAIERLGQKQEDGPDPQIAQQEAEQAAKAQEMQAQQAEKQQDMQMRQAERAEDMQFKQAEAAQKLEFERAKHEMDLQHRAEEMALKREEMGMKREEMAARQQETRDKMEFEKRKFDGTEAGAAAATLDSLREGGESMSEAVQQALALSAEALQQIAALRDDLSQPKVVDVHRVNGRIAGGSVTQGGITSEVTLN